MTWGAPRKRARPVGPLEQGQELVNSHSAAADERAKRTDREFFVLRNREIDTDARFHHDNVAADLPEFVPSGPLEGLDRALARDIGEAGHRQLDGYDDRRALRVTRQIGCSLLVFGPEPRGDCLLDVAQGSFFTPALGNAAGKCRALYDKPAVFCLFNDDVEYHLLFEYKPPKA
jgi:hypothetical protein